MRTVGACRPAGRSTGNQWARIGVPSKEVTVQSLDTPATGAAITGCVAPGWWHGPREEGVATVWVPGDEDATGELEHEVKFAATAAAPSTPARAGTNRRWAARRVCPLVFTRGVSHPGASEAITAPMDPSFRPSSRPIGASPEAVKTETECAVSCARPAWAVFLGPQSD
jgi:hypothetical protein